MKVVGTVAPDEVPESQVVAKGIWTGLAARAVHEHQHERILVVSVKDEDEFRRLRNGVAGWLRDKGFKLAATVVPGASKTDEWRVFMVLHLIDEGHRNGAT